MGAPNIKQQKLDEEIAVEIFAGKMRGKLDKHRVANSHSWKSSKLEDLEVALLQAYRDSDWVSVGNYAMMLDNLTSD